MPGINEDYVPYYYIETVLNRKWDRFVIVRFRYRKEPKGSHPKKRAQIACVD